MGKKIMDIKTRRDASRGRKSKAGGGKKSKATQEYTPLQIFKKTSGFIEYAMLQNLKDLLK